MHKHLFTERIMTIWSNFEEQTVIAFSSNRVERNMDHNRLRHSYEILKGPIGANLVSSGNELCGTVIDL